MTATIGVRTVKPVTRPETTEVCAAKKVRRGVTMFVVMKVKRAAKTGLRWPHRQAKKCLPTTARVLRNSIHTR